jgi:NADPH:quinone reductase-like Zn-dependent oxidoreductase
MKIMRLSDSEQLSVLAEEDGPLPQPRRDELLIRVYAAGVTPTELLWYPTTHSKNGESRSHAVPGHEFSGVIAAMGEDVVGFEIGQEVYGMNDWFSDGALAEYCLTQPTSVAQKPRSLTHTEAASVPIGTLTAWQGLFARARLQAGESVLVHGGAGAVGVFAIQLARLHGAHVITTASARNHAFLSRLGAERVIDYRAVRFEESVRDIDVVFDTVGGDTLRRSWGVLKPGGRMITIAADSETSTDERVKQAFFIVEPNQTQLIQTGDRLEKGDLQPVVDAVLPLARASAAYTGEVKQRRGCGKLVVTVVAQ